MIPRSADMDAQVESGHSEDSMLAIRVCIGYRCEQPTPGLMVIIIPIPFSQGVAKVIVSIHCCPGMFQGYVYRGASGVLEPDPELRTPFPWISINTPTMEIRCPLG